MVLDFLGGSRDVFVEVDSTTLEMWTMTGETMFRSYRELDPLERLALQACDGRILDVGAGAGCHTLYLQEQGQEVEALDISPGCVEVLNQRGVKTVLHQNIFALEKRKYKTILMLMNGLGICGTLDGCNLFLQFVKTILEVGGQVIADSTDLGSLYTGPTASDYLLEGYCGETEFVMKYKDLCSDPFTWLYIDYTTLVNLVHFNNLRCERLLSAEGGRYLVRIYS